MSQSELETRVTLVEEGKTELQNCCKQWENEVAVLLRRLEGSQSALHELGRENQSLRVLNQRRMTHFLFIIKKMIHVFLPSL